MVIRETDERFYVGESGIPGAGWGLFARRDLPAGERLAVIGVLVERDSLADACTRYADEYKLRVGDHLLLIPCGFAALANHSAQPNLEKVVEGESLFLRLTRDVAAGEELCFAYSAYALARFGIDDA
jgi:SET domain-containing protein